ncbi:type VI secretion system accessory protein TagJ [Comamonas composti]|uniref:type VI secretion system accessory protein TagJ n=1 Tax=Comamonas composti TaxID=408558 RepID=UPI00040890FF|nr:type VI secretion system accessory protein TagJ [Comamonas composti]
MSQPIGHLSSLLNKAQTLADAQRLLEAQVRDFPEDAGRRWTLAQWACLQESWPRALKLAQATAKQQPSLVQSAHAMRALIRAQQQRESIFAGQRTAEQLLPWAPWTEQLAAALQLQAQGNTKQADALRLVALEQAPTWQGQTPAGLCTWLADSDSRLGPVCELIVSGSYRWLPLADIESLEVEPPATLLDLMWIPVQITLKPNTVIDKPFSAFIPVRYPGTLSYMQKDIYPETMRLSLLLGRKTLWHETSETAVCGIGQKTWISDAGEFSLFESKSLTSSIDNSDITSGPEHAG